MIDAGSAFFVVFGDDLRVRRTAAVIKSLGFSLSVPNAGASKTVLEPAAPTFGRGGALSRSRQGPRGPRIGLIAALASAGFALGLGLAWLAQREDTGEAVPPVDDVPAVASTPAAADPCANIVCPGGAVCTNGVCSIAVPPVQTGSEAAAKSDLPEEEDDNSAGPTEPLAGPQPAVVYRARISRLDHENSNGRPHSEAASMIHQDRAWYHRFGRRDPDDQGDALFGLRENRDWLGDVLEHAIPRDVARQIEEGTPLVEVRVWRSPDRAEVRIVSP